jgi:hypothetical protein
VFIPINIREMHWYLVVINARNMEIQVLDSLGTSSGLKHPDPLGLKCKTITSPRRLVTTFLTSNST